MQTSIVEMVMSAQRIEQYSSDYYNQHFGLVEVLFSEAGVRVRRV
jgi:hypothetical protein